jgi:prevent-host-death family protein
MKTWPVHDAKAHFSELLNACERDGPQIVTKRGAEMAVLVPISEWRRLATTAHPTLKELLLSDEARFVRVRGAIKVKCHLMFGILVLAVDQIFRVTAFRPAPT